MEISTSSIEKEPISAEDGFRARSEERQHVLSKMSSEYVGYLDTNAVTDDERSKVDHLVSSSLKQLDEFHTLVDSIGAEHRKYVESILPAFNKQIAGIEWAFEFIETLEEFVKSMGNCVKKLEDRTLECEEQLVPIKALKTRISKLKKPPKRGIGVSPPASPADGIIESSSSLPSSSLPSSSMSAGEIVSNVKLEDFLAKVHSLSLTFPNQKSSSIDSKDATSESTSNAVAIIDSGDSGSVIVDLDD